MPATDDFDTYGVTLSSPLEDGFQIVPTDAAGDDGELPKVTRMLYLGVGGDLRVQFASGAIVPFTDMPAGWHPMRVRRVFATGTTASSINGCL